MLQEHATHQRQHRLAKLGQGVGFERACRKLQTAKAVDARLSFLDRVPQEPLLFPQASFTAGDNTIKEMS